MKLKELIEKLQEIDAKFDKDLEVVSSFGDDCIDIISLIELSIMSFSEYDDIILEDVKPDTDVDKINSIYIG